MTVIAVFLGGSAGTALRYAADLLFGAIPGGSPGWSTLAVNVLGSFLLGLVVARLPEGAPHWLRAGLGTGLLGGFTTFSALAALVAIGIGGDGWALVVGQLVLNLLLGVAAAMAGLALGPGSRRVPVVSEDE